MPVAPRSPGKARAIALRILGTPNKPGKASEKDKQIQEKMFNEDLMRQR